LKQIWNEVRSSQGLIIDLRNCVGGDAKVSNFIAGSLLGGGKLLFREVPRPGSAQSVAVEYSDPDVARFTGSVAILTNSNTESGPEVLAAICKEYGCARLIGERTAGAFNGWTIAIGLPDHFARFALPYTRGISPKGIEYEGRGVDPGEKIINTIQDFQTNRDLPVIKAMRYVTMRR
jgi:C-terminal processing protease CtpA/Prc